MAWILSRPSGIPDPINVGAFGVTALSYSASITPDASLGGTLTITPSNASAFTINAPVNLASGQRLQFTIKNTTGGPLGAVTWNAIYKLAAWTNPANGNSRSIEFVYDGVRLTEVNRTANDIPN
jgi:hypothetical protein